MKWLALLKWLVPIFFLAGEAFCADAVVVMHGKGGSPLRYVDGLAAYLEQQGFLVANLEMPWSGRRGYDVDVAAAEGEVEAALEGLRAKGARKRFVIGHSQGGVFALYFGTRHAVDGIVTIAPGGSTAAPVFLEKLGPSFARARSLVAEGKGAQKERFLDFEGSRGTSPVVTAAAVYVTWFDPDGAMNEGNAVRALPPRTPVLFVAPSGDYPALARVKGAMFGALPKNPGTRLYEPVASHLEAPSASKEAIAAWIKEVAGP
ncbi:MAG TPA: alpha/beta fold hydrolase [Burkholderiales bacterium]|nr:alpha/beta fold hydrolase [Burkholderiales bacterium]